MLARALRTVILPAVLACFASLSTGCYAYADEDLPPPQAEYGYQPQFYDGAVVYYDDGGRPYYYAESGPIWVPVTSPLYIGYVNHWHTYGVAYRNWYRARGYQYRGYRPHVAYHPSHVTHVVAHPHVSHASHASHGGGHHR